VFSVMNSSEYSPVSGREQEPREIKTEDQAELLRLALTHDTASTDGVVELVFWTLLTPSKSDFGGGGGSGGQRAPATRRYSAIGTARSEVVKGPNPLHHHTRQ
jgi:hypothetical protein